MGARPITERVAEVKKKREKTKKKLEQYDEQIKRLEKQDADEKRRQRTHSLVVCGAELAALFGKILNASFQSPTVKHLFFCNAAIYYIGFIQIVTGIIINIIVVC